MQPVSMDPIEVARRLNMVALSVERSAAPSRRRVVAALKTILLATDRSLAEAVGRSLAEQVAKLMPEEFSGETFDTSDRGKGFKSGYVSWAMDPNTWEAAGILGGILFMCRFDPGQYRSEAPEGDEEWDGHSKGEAALELTIQGAYYNKLLGGGVDQKTDLGSCTVLLDAKENVVEAEIADPAKLQKGVASIVQTILTSPPDEAVSAGRKRKALPPTTSPKTLLNWLTEQNRTDVKRSELDDLARSMSKRTGEPLEQAKRRVTDFFRSRTWPIDEETSTKKAASQGQS